MESAKHLLIMEFFVEPSIFLFRFWRLEKYAALNRPEFKLTPFVASKINRAVELVTLRKNCYSRFFLFLRLNA